MPTYTAPGLPADWVNGWLAALGVTILVPDCRLSWTNDPTPIARLDHDDIITALINAFPTSDSISDLAIARHHQNAHHEFPRTVPLDAYNERAALAARHGDASLACTVTDLNPGKTEPISHSPFDPSAPQGITVHQRLTSCRNSITDPSNNIPATLQGRGKRQPMNGLGFDYTRLFSPTIPGTDTWCEPVIEVLAFYGLAYIPVRGDGTRTHTRGWNGPASRRHSFTWPTWTPSLEAPAIDALLDRVWSAATGSDLAAGTYGSVAYRPKTSTDVTRAYASERIA